MKCKGFTLLELIIVFIISIILLLASSFFMSCMNHKYIYAVKRELIEIVHFSRALALSRGERVCLIPLNDNNWAQGIQLILASKKNKQKKILKVWSFSKKKLHIEWHGFNNHQQIIFSPSPLNWAVNGKFYISYHHNQEQIVVNRLGRIVEVA